jgi:hypothetical protein
MLVATLRERIEQIRLLADAAGLKPQAITATTLALAAVSQKEDVLHLSVNGVELATRGSDGLPRLCHIAPGSMVRNQSGLSATPQIVGELRRALALTQRKAGSAGMQVWDDTGAAAALFQDLASELKMRVSPGERFDAVAVEGIAAARAAAGAALAVCQFRPELAPVDLLHSRLAVKPPARLSPRAIWGAVAGLLLALGAAYLVGDWYQGTAEEAELHQKREEAKEKIETAQAYIDRVNATRTWYDRRPNYLECLRAITLCFPEEGRAWTSSLSLREDMRGILNGRAVDRKSVLDVVDMRGVLNGRAVDRKSVLDVVDQMKLSRALTNVKLLQMRETGTKNSEVSFGIGFAFQGAEPK